MRKASPKLQTLLAVFAATTISACGGGGSDAGTAAPPPAAGQDARNGTYHVTATDMRTYALSVDFDARTYTMSGNGVNSSGSFTHDGAGTYTMAGNASPAS